MEAAHLLSISTLLKALPANVRINFYISMKYDLCFQYSGVSHLHQIQPTLTQEIDEWIFVDILHCGYNMQLFLAGLHPNTVTKYVQ